MLKRFLCLSGAVLALSACATTQTTGNSDKIFATEDSQLFADYLIGSYSNYIGDADTRAEYFNKAFEQDETNKDLGRKAITSAITAGDNEGARRLAKDVLDKHPGEPMSRAFLGAEAFANGNYSRADRYFKQTTDDITVRLLMDIMGAWSKSAQGDNEAGLATLENLGGAAYFEVLGRVMQANMAGSDGDIEKAKATYDIAMGAGIATTEVALSKTRLLYASGDPDEALSSLQAFDNDNGNFESGPVRTYLDKLEAGDDFNISLTPNEEAAWALTESAYGFFLRNRAFDAAELYIRMALVIDPDNEKAKIWLAALIEDERQDEALELYRAVPETSSYIVSAKLSEANIYFDREEDEKAIAILEETNAKHSSFTTREALGRARLIRENYEDALPIYDALIASMSEEEIKKDVQPLYFRAICYERLKQWDKAVADFKRVLELEPDNADALNYLGYTWVDRNENLTEAFDMIERAVELEPQSGAIVDSLGWAHYKLGRYSEARRNLEKAVALTPNSATIIDHLGDTYWKLGRYREAGYQWERALEYEPTDEERANIEAKLKGGLSFAISK